MKKALTVLLIALVAMTAIFAQAAAESKAGGSGELILYTTVSQAHYDIAIAKFNELYPNITVYYTYGGPVIINTAMPSSGSSKSSLLL